MIYNNAYYKKRKNKEIKSITIYMVYFQSWEFFDTDEMNKASYVYSKVKDAINNNKQYIILYGKDLKNDSNIIINVNSITDIAVEYYEEQNI